MYLRVVLLPVIAIALLVSCKPKPKAVTKEYDGKQGTYFSVNQFIKDQWNTHLGQPYSLIKVTTKNGKADSTIVNALTMDWGDIFKRFFSTDIGDPKYVGHYDFNMFLDESTDTRNFYYEAKDDTLFTRKLQITALQENNKITHIYIETEKRSSTKDVIQKLYYAPMSVIQMQEFDALATGDKSHVRIEYFFM
jgi:hypothetical protein